MNHPRDWRCHNCGFDKEYRHRRRSEEEDSLRDNNSYRDKERGRGYHYENSSSRWEGRPPPQYEDPYDYPRRSFEHPRGDSFNEKRSDDFQEALDEFGRKLVDVEKNKPKAKEWPPCFDDFGSQFTFDTRSGMFYEAESDFFYDAKTKLYYGNRSKLYYRYDTSITPPFRQVEASEVTAAQSEVANVASSRPSSGESKRSSISINITTKPKKKKAKVESEQSRMKKEQEDDLKKWSDRQVEKKIERKVRRTAKGEPICDLCKRKFATMEKLEYHERVSQLHKDNLLKKKQSVEAAAKEKMKYVDRAEQRRNLHGDDVVPDRELPPVEPTKTDPSLGESNIGHQMLTKMSGGKGVPKTEQQERLSKDWDRIESMSDGKLRPPRGIGNS